MKYVCVDSEYEEGFFKKTICKLEGLTVGKTYDGTPINMPIGGGSASLRNEIELLVYDDNKEWETYSIHRFKPE